MQNKHWMTKLGALSVWFTCMLGSPAEASPLYTLNVAGTGNLLLVDTASGAAAPVAPDRSLGPGSWNGLSSWPTDSNIVFAVNNPRPARFEDPQFSRLSRIDLASGTATLFPHFDSDVLGSPEVFSLGVAISPLDPNIAVVVGVDRRIPPTNMMFRVDVTTGAVLDTALQINDASRIESLTFSPDGATLFGTDDDGRLVNLDPDTAQITIVGDPELTDFVTGLAFRPSDGALFAIDGLRQDRLVILDPASGTLVADVGPLGIVGPEGLAFVPEPSTMTFLWWGTLIVSGTYLRRRGDAFRR